MLPFHWSAPDLAPFSDEERKDSVTQAVGILAAHSRGPRFEVNYGSYTGSDTRVNCR
jgi:hypothetical protein